jgi:PQQ-dependent catabolism-associated CXXCW motif protein
MALQISRLAFAALIALLPAEALRAQTDGDGFGGSFEPEAPAAATHPAATPDAGSSADDFGGSFGDGTAPPAGSGGTTPPAPDQTPAVGAPPTVIGGDDFDDGSFNDTAPQPPQPQPQPPQPQPPQPQPPQPQPPQPPQPQPPQPQPPPPGPNEVQVPDQVTQLELQDYGVPPTSTLRQGRFHAATPTQIPGGQVVTTKALADAMNAGTRIILIDVLANQYSLPGALMAPALAQGGTFSDRLQQQAAQWLQQITGGDTTVPIVIYCSDPMCWLSYNASLRTIAAGYGNVYWYRGGLHAWQMSGFNLQPSSF